MHPIGWEEERHQQSVDFARDMLLKGQRVSQEAGERAAKEIEAATVSYNATHEVRSRSLSSVEDDMAALGADFDDIKRLSAPRNKKPVQPLQELADKMFMLDMPYFPLSAKTSEPLQMKSKALFVMDPGEEPEAPLV